MFNSPSQGKGLASEFHRSPNNDRNEEGEVGEGGGGAVGFNGRPIKKQIDREKKITARCTIVCFPWSEGCDVCRTHACCHRILILSITHANCCPETLSKTKYDK